MSTPPPPGDQPWNAAPPPGPGYGAPAAPPLRPDEEKTWAILAHLLPFVAGFLAPLVIWLVFRGRGPYLEHQAKESLNFQLTLLIAYVVGSILLIIVVGAVILIAAAILQIVLQIMAAIAASRFEWYRYPVSIRFIK
ncbi:DUF4870 domain-containing protein [Cellulomonas sp. DKR-3]|uniref:DUF4870 domain-containing protein n=1 Tax=Cellulomonas fulva TaxID=2835530 RepID=A0ABS5U011_9CELL|nr:DUF4870 domain-containing protein [Cellulomonas fulva]MBT0994739.1 DUF4870 domain-containing protein [Cellulomonas fulva]